MTLDDLLGMTDEQLLALDDDVLLAATAEFLHRYGPPTPGIEELCMRTVQDVLGGGPSAIPSPS